MKLLPIQAYNKWRNIMYIPYSKECHDKALYEQKKRKPYMFTKFANNAKRKAGQIRGLIIEHHVSGWFQANYNNNFIFPDNHEVWEQPCPHDFKININGKTIVIDVSGPKADLSFGSYALKPTHGVDFHILCFPIGMISWSNIDFTKGFDIKGVVSNTNYTMDIDPSNIIDFGSFIKSINLP